ncbi:MAG: DUF2079 domain-containing protein, partial [Bacteroidota bacterium]
MAKRVLNFLHPKIYILLVFACIFILISLVNHYNFRTYGFDLGIYNNALFDYSRFQINDNPIMHPRFNNVLSDHFSLYHFVFAPFRYIFGSWTLLIFQIAAILFGALGIQKVVNFLTENHRFSLIAMVHFLSIWGIYSALAFDYHDNVVAAMFVPWLIWYVLQKKYIPIAIWTFIIFVSRENMSLWLAFIYLGLFVWKFKDSEIRIISLLGVLFSVAYFIFVLKFAMPYFADPDRTYAHFKYGALGDSPSEILENVFLRPKYMFSTLFESHYSNTNYNGIKTELHYIILLSGGIALLYRPQFLIMLIPIYVQKLFHSDFAKWGVNNHYSIEFAPILTLSFFYWISQLHISNRLKTRILIGGTIICFAATISIMPARKSKWYNKNAVMFYSAKHYQRNFDVEKVHEFLDEIPDDAKVSAQNMLVPHLAFRDDIYLFPVLVDAEYIALVPKAG